MEFPDQKQAWTNTKLKTVTGDNNKVLALAAVMAVVALVVPALAALTYVSERGRWESPVLRAREE